MHLGNILCPELLDKELLNSWDLESLDFSTLVSTNHMPHSVIVRLHMILSNREDI